METDVTAIALRFGLHPKSFAQAENAILSKVFILDNEYVLRARKLWSEAISKLESEQVLIETVRSLIPFELPRLIKTDAGEKFLIEAGLVWTAYPMITGETLTDWWTMGTFPEPAYEKSFLVLKELHARTRGHLGGIDPLKGYRFLSDIREQFEHLKDSLDAAVIVRLKEAIEQTAGAEKKLPEEDFVFVHGDFHPGNLVFKNGEVKGILDTDWSRKGHPLEDLGYAVMNFMRDCEANAFVFDEKKFNDFIGWYGLPDLDIPLLGEYMILYALFDVHGFASWNTPNKEHLIRIQNSVLTDFCKRF